MLFELEAYTFEEEQQQPATVVCVELSGTTDRPLAVDVATIDGTAMGMSIFGMYRNS